MFEAARDACAAYARRLRRDVERHQREYTGGNVVDYIRTGGRLIRDLSGDECIEEETVDVTLMRGTEIMVSVREAVARLSLTPNGLQAGVQNGIIQSMLPQLYKADWDTHRDAICKYWGIAELTNSTKLALQCPRRFGKTTSVAMLVALLLRFMDGIDILVVATATRAAKEFNDAVAGFLRDIKGDAFMSSNSEEVVCRPGGDRWAGCKNKLTALPGNARTSRGKPGQLIIVDEAAFVCEEMYTGVIYPAAMVTGTVVAALSSPPEEGGTPFSAMFDATLPDGRKVFRTIEVSLVCADCQRDRKTDCKHVEDAAPAWQSAESMAELKALYDKMGDPDAFNREMKGGAGCFRVIRAFQDRDVDALRDRAVYRAGGVYREVFLSVDPSGAGKGSDTAMTVTARDENGNLVVRFGAWVGARRGEGTPAVSRVRTACGWRLG